MPKTEIRGGGRVLRTEISACSKKLGRSYPLARSLKLRQGEGLRPNLKDQRCCAVHEAGPPPARSHEPNRESGSGVTAQARKCIHARHFCMTWTVFLLGESV